MRNRLLLSDKSQSELTYQLSSRITWLLEPADGNARLDIFNNVRKLYSVRSRIVHGSPYGVREYDENEEQLLDLTRRVFCAVLGHDAAWKALLDGDTSDDFLKKLSIGII
jgi:Apea-like HEPN